MHPNANFVKHGQHAHHKIMIREKEGGMEDGHHLYREKNLGSVGGDNPVEFYQTVHRADALPEVNE